MASPTLTSFPLEKETSLGFMLCMGFIHTPEAGSQGGGQQPRPTRDTQHYSHRLCGRDRVLTGSSCISRPWPPLRLCTHSPWHTSHILQGNRSSSLEIKWVGGWVDVCSVWCQHLSPSKEREKQYGGGLESHQALPRTGGSPFILPHQV